MRCCYGVSVKEIKSYILLSFFINTEYNFAQGNDKAMQAICVYVIKISSSA